MKYLERAEEALMAIFLVIMTVMTFAQVVMRYVFNSGITWSLEATTFSFGWLVLIGMSVGIRANTHLAVDVATNTLMPGLKKLTAIIAVALSLLYAGLMLWGSWELIGRLGDLGNLARDIPLPRWLLLIILPIGFGLLGFRLLQAAGEIIKGTREGLGQQQEGSASVPSSEED